MSGDRTGMTFNVKAGEYMNELEAENARLREAILTWYNGSPEDAASDEQLCQVAVSLQEPVE